MLLALPSAPRLFNFPSSSPSKKASPTSIPAPPFPFTRDGDLSLNPPSPGNRNSKAVAVSMVKIGLQGPVIHG